MKQLKYLKIKEMEKMKNRYVVTFDMYIYADNDYMARKKAHSFTDKLKKKFDNQAAVLDIVEQPFGSLGSRKVDPTAPSNNEKSPF